jgi:ThiF family
MNLLTLPRTLLARLLRLLLHRPEGILCPVGFNHTADRRETLLRAPETGGPHMLVRLSEELTFPDTLPPDGVGWLTLGRQSRSGRAAGELLRAKGTEPFDHLFLVGAGMHRLPLHAAALEVEVEVPQRWSRTAGALGQDVWQRLVRLTYGVVGAGRTGSALAELLVGLGVRRLILIDPDALDEGNLGEMTTVLTDADVGQPKSVALANRLPRRLGLPAVEPLARSITHVRALRAVQDCDVLCTCVDHDGARLAAAALATLFYRPHLDVGVGIHGHGAARQMGADVRLLLPGEGCLLCQGLANEAGARAALRSADAEAVAFPGGDWRRQRAGSLRSLNQVASSLALRLWEDFVGERLTSGLWLHVEIDAAGRLSARYPTPQGWACPLCRLAGSGEDGLSAAAALFGEPPG